MAAASRWSMLQEVDVCCPRCQRALPPVPVSTSVHASGKRTLRLDIVPMLDEAWWSAARADHPQCVPDGRPVPVDGDDGREVLEG
jgi:hypothetical protein